MTPDLNKTIVIGLGNPILTDDGIGVLAAREIEALFSDDKDDRPVVREACTGGLRLMECLEGFEKAILIDAYINPGVEPGTILRLTLEDLAAAGQTEHTASAHDTSLPTAIATGKQIGMTLPEDVVAFGVAASNVIDFGETPTEAVLNTLPILVARVFEELDLPLPARIPLTHFRIPIEV